MSVHIDRLAISIAAILSLASNVNAATPQVKREGAEPPQRRPGLWRLSTISPDVGLQTHEACIEAGDSILGAVRENCSAPTVEFARDDVIVTFSCDLRGAREVTSLLFTGDFTSRYRVQSKTTLTQAGGATRERSGFTIEATFLGPECPKSPAR